jgi:adenosylcobinamide-GDP ribazoletransferase
MAIVHPRVLRADLLACLAFYTRLPFDGGDPAGRGFAAAQWAAPLAGLAVAMCGAAVLAVCDLAGLPVMLGALLAVAATMLASGALHEDGLADTADGFGGGRTRERKLEIMRDSRIGSYGAAALVFSILLRAGAIAAILPPTAAGWALVAAHMAGRAIMPTFMNLLPPARSDGLSAGVGVVPRETALAALGLGAVALLPLGFGAALVAATLLALWVFAFRRFAELQVGGHTGDVLGALEQGGEIVVLLVAASFLHP